MKILIVTLVCLVICGVANGLTCYQCDGQISNAQCTMANNTVNCTATDEQCYANKIPISNKISKGCKSKTECAAISVGNFVGYSLAYCCTTNLCNVNGASTLAPSTITSAPLMAASILAALVTSTRLAAF